MNTREIQNFVGLVTFIPQYCAYFSMHCGYKLVFLMLKAFSGIDPELFFSRSIYWGNVARNIFRKLLF